MIFLVQSSALPSEVLTDCSTANRHNNERSRYDSALRRRKNGASSYASGWHDGDVGAAWRQRRRQAGLSRLKAPRWCRLVVLVTRFPSVLCIQSNTAGVEPLKRL